jgi:acyl-CoA thioester hydrolase
VVRPEWIDYNGHMNVGYYHVAFDVAAEAFFEFLGFTAEFRRSHDATTFALEAHLNFLREVKQGDALRFEARLLDHDAKRIHFYQEMFHAGEGFLAATCESLSAYVSQAAPLAGRPCDLGHTAAIRRADNPPYKLRQAHPPVADQGSAGHLRWSAIPRRRRAPISRATIRSGSSWTVRSPLSAR